MLRVRVLVLIVAACGDNAIPAAHHHDGSVAVDAGVVDGEADARTDSVSTDAGVDAPPDVVMPLIVVVDCLTAAIATTVTNSNQAYTPKISTIGVGGVVQFTIDAPHDAQSGTPAMPLPWFAVDGGAGSRCLRFDEPGSFAFYCSLHPNMTGSIIVTP